MPLPTPTAGDTGQFVVVTSYTKPTISSRGPVVGRVRLAGWSCITRGIHQPTADLTAADQLTAWAQTLPRSGAFTHLTAARLLGLWTPPGAAAMPVTVAVSDHEWRPRRAGVRGIRLAEVPRGDNLAGLPMTTTAEVVLACARHLAWLDLLVLVDSALHLGACAAEDLVSLAATRRRGAKALRRVLPYAEPLTESAGETLLRMAHVLAGVPVVAQHVVTDEHGQTIGRADLWIRGTRRLPEYDGAYHRDAAQYERDRRRDRKFQRAGWQPYSYSVHGVLRQHTSIVRDADDALGRAHDPARSRLFGGALDESCWSAGGAPRLARRLHDPRL